jgi:hypothetical protein
MTREAWTPLTGAVDILRYLKSRSHWGAIIWTLALGVAISDDPGSGTSPSRHHLMIALAGGVGAGLAMTWRLHERLQWAGLVPYMIATSGVLLVIVPLTLIAYLIWQFESPRGLLWFVAMAVLGVLLRGVGATAWLAPYRRGPTDIRPR